jgi:alpha-mannosidase
VFRESRRIELHNEITQNFADVRSWGFDFNLDQPDVWHEEVGAVIRAKLIPNGGHYSPRNARYDWLTLNHFADISGADGFGVTLSNSDCAFMQLGRSTAALLDTTTPLLSVLVGGQVDGAKFGIPNQGGDTHFTQRFALQTRDGFDAATAMRFALEHQNPLQTGVVVGGHSYPGNEYSLLGVSNNQVVAWAVKPAEAGKEGSVILRIWNLSHHPERASVQLAMPPAAARQVTHLETDLGETRIEGTRLPAEFAAQQLRTFQIQFDPERGR